MADPGDAMKDDYELRPARVTRATMPDRAPIEGEAELIEQLEEAGARALYAWMDSTAPGTPIDVRPAIRIVLAAINERWLLVPRDESDPQREAMVDKSARALLPITPPWMDFAVDCHRYASAVLRAALSPEEETE